MGDQKCDVFEVTKMVVKISQDVIGQQSVTKRKKAWKSYQKLLNSEFVWDRNIQVSISLSQADTSGSVPC